MALNAEIEKQIIVSDVQSRLGRVLVYIYFVAALDWMNTVCISFFFTYKSPNGLTRQV